MSFSWWEQIFGPAQFSHDLIEAMRGASQVIVLAEKPLPFRDELYELICRQRGSFSPNFIHAEEIPETPEEYLLQNHASIAVRTDFRPAKHDLVAYLAESGTLSGNLFWIVNANGEKGKQWHRFLTSWAANDKKKCAEFVLEHSGPPLSVRKGLAVLRPEKQCTDYDMLLFAHGELADLHGTLEIKQYLAWLIARLAEGDPERCRALCREPHCLLWNPEQVLGEDFKRLLPIFRESQLRFCLPELERRRLSLVGDTEYRSQLETLLPITDDYGNKIDLPEEMELRHILYWASRSRENIFPYETWSSLTQMKDIRDSLMHKLGGGLAPEQITFLLGNLQRDLVSV